MNVISLEEFISGFNVPNRLAVFIDDTGSPSGIPGTLVKDFVAFAAVVVRTERLGELDADHVRFLSQYPGVREFHANDIRMKKKEWGCFSEEECLAAFSFWRDCLLRYTEIVPYVYIGVDQFIETIRPKIDQALSAGEIKQVDGWNWKSHKSIARRVFVTALQTWLRSQVSCDSLIMIRDLQDQEESGIQEIWEPGSGVYLDGVFQLDSIQLAGLQLADLAAYPLTRIHYIRALMKAGKKLDAFDELLGDLLMNSGRRLYSNLLGGDIETLLWTADDLAAVFPTVD